MILLSPSIQFLKGNLSMRPLLTVCATLLLLGTFFVPASSPQNKPPQLADQPRCHDPRLTVERFAAAPDIVHPVGIVCDVKGRLLVIESHTHFPPKDYAGPKHDRIRMVEDTDGDGKADRFTTYYDGLQRTMDIAAHPDGSIFVATRNEVVRLRDTRNDGKADEVTRIVFLDTKGDYPHNGISGLVFDLNGDLLFGLGENLGADYRLIGSDGATLTGGGEGGSIFRCTADGKILRRMATGFWNPFGICVDIYGRVFAVDNDPDSTPPCRLLHIVEGGDYGYQYRYGRSGRHLFQAWNGQLPGTLVMMSGTGEGPCEIISYESDGLPREYLGNLLVASWADHRIERYVPKERGASYTAERQSFLQGGKEFRPVGIAVAPDGSLFVSDWVRVDYQLHNQGAIWRIKPRTAEKQSRPNDPKQALFSLVRERREVAARTLARQGETGRSFLREQLTHTEPRVRATALAALLTVNEPQLDLQTIAERDSVPALRAMAVKAIVARSGDATRFLNDQHPSAVRVEAVASLRDRPRLLALLQDADPFLYHATVQRLGQLPDLWIDMDMSTITEVRQRLGLLLAARASGDPRALQRLPLFLRDAEEEVRFLAVKWIADDKLVRHRSWLKDAIQDPKLSGRMHFACATALARIEGKDVNEVRMADHFAERLADPQSSPALKTLALQFVPATHKKLTPELFRTLMKQEDPSLRLASIRLLCEHPGPRRTRLLQEVADDERQGMEVRAQALAGLAEQGQAMTDKLLNHVEGKHSTLRDEALRSLAKVKLSSAERERLEQVARTHPKVAPLVARALGRAFVVGRPPADNLTSWLQQLEGPADVMAGRRIFFHTKLTGCCNCHRIEGRGKDIGPDLTAIGRTERRQILESILQPNANIAPHFQVWVLTTTAGKTYTGMLIHTYLDEQTYVDAEGMTFKLNSSDIVESRMVPTSLMPEGLADRLTDQELRDLLAYLTSLR
jgi:putative membrane-bound dehydrogenase-like protein